MNCLMCDTKLGREVFSYSIDKKTAKCCSLKCLTAYVFDINVESTCSYVHKTCANRSNELCLKFFEMCPFNTENSMLDCEDYEEK